MEFLSQQWRYRSAFVVSSILAIWLGFFVFSPEVAISVIRFGGYWLMAITVGLFVFAGYRFIRTFRFSSPKRDVDWLRWVMVAAVSLLIQIHEPHGFKVTMDELVLGATSMSMHMDREVFCPSQTNTLDGMFLVTGGIIDKRPYFFAFILSLAHDLVGYRPENVFFLNAIIGFLLLGLAGELAERISNRAGGRLAVLLLAGLPLLAINFTGGGFEVLNLCMIVITMLAAIIYLERKDAVSLNFLVFSGVLLAQTRYESVMFIVPVGVVILMGWWRNRSIQLTLPLIIAPILLVPSPLLNLIVRAYSGFWQLPTSLESPFSLGFLPDNLAHSVAYLFEFNSLQSNSVLLSYLGSVALVFFVVFFVRRVASLHALKGSHLVILLFGLVIVMNFSLLMCYHWGKLDQFVVSRLGLPLMLLMAIVVPFVMAEFKLSTKAWNGSVGLAAGFFLFVAVPASSRAYPTESSLPYRETAWFLDFVRAHRNEGAYFVIPSSLPAVILREPGSSITYFQRRAKEIDYHLKRGTYSKVFVLQRMAENLATGELIETENSRIGDDFTLEILDERKFGMHYRSRISLLTKVDVRPEIDDGSDEIREIRRIVNLDLAVEGEKGRKIQEFIHMLP